MRAGARPRVLLGAANQAGTHRIQLHVRQGGDQMVAVQRARKETVLPAMPAAPVEPVEALRMAGMGAAEGTSESARSAALAALADWQVPGVSFR